MGEVYDYIIVGGGPTGITIASIITSDENSNKTVLILESDKDSLGGCWKIDWENIDDDFYLTEHSPKVLMKSNHLFFQLLDHLDVYYSLNNIQDSILGNMNMMFQVISSFHYKDYIAFLSTIMSFFVNPKSFDFYETLQEWMTRNNMSDSACLFLDRLSVILSNTSDKVCIGAFVHYISIDPGFVMNLYQLNKPNKWIEKATDHLKNTRNCTIKLGVHVKSVHEGGFVTDVSNTIYKCKNIIIATPISCAFQLIENSCSTKLKTNWFHDMDQFRYFVDKSTYTGISFQMHFKEDMNYKNTNFAVNDWKIIVMEKNKCHQKISSDHRIKSVLSCVIVDLDTPSRYTHKSVNDYDQMDDVIQEAIRQLSVTFKKQFQPYKITIHKNVKRLNNRWISIHSGYANCVGSIPYKGSCIDNVFIVGPHNIGSFSIVEHAVKSALLFCRKEGITDNIFKGYQLPHKKNVYYIYIIVLMIMILIITQVT